MSDLISRSELIENFRKCYSGHLGMENSGSCMTFHGICNVINNTNTVYDIDNVVAELEERTDFLKDCTKYGNKNSKQQAESYNTMMMYEVADLVDDLIEIVKHGGVE